MSIDLLGFAGLVLPTRLLFSKAISIIITRGVLLEMVARIFKPAKTAMQSGRRKSDNWLLEFDREDARKRDPLMGYTSSSDMKSQLHLSFETLEDAENYAAQNGISYVVVKPKVRKISRVSYADNFKYGRQTPWTH